MDVLFYVSLTVIILTYKGLPHLEYLTAVRGTVNVLAGLVHAKRHTVEQDHHDANPLEPCADRAGVKERGRRERAKHTSASNTNVYMQQLALKGGIEREGDTS